MKIAVIGAPGAGKSKFARGLRKNLNGSDHVDTKIGITDRYVEKLAKRTGLAFGHFASYPENFMVVGERLAAEYATAQTYKHQIVCGTVIDTTVYCAMHGDVAMNNTSDDMRRAEYVRTSATMQALGMLQADTWTYDYAFFLPYTEEQESGDPTWDAILNDTLITFLDTIDAPVIHLPIPEKDRVQAAREVIDLVAKNAES